jgi:1-acyl-sn-glycerol-3-phosphate acyltransferase
MIRTLFWYTFFWLYMIASLSFHIPLLFMQLFRLKKIKRAYLSCLAGFWARSIVWATGARVTIHGKENIPGHNCICYVSNHQSVFDIPLIMGYVSNTVGFIAKKELRYIPILGTWILEAGCVFINRKSPRESIEVIKRGVENIKRGFPMVIFPEGTRSKSNTMRPFKSGSLKLAIRSKAPIIPITIDGSYKLREEHGGLIAPASVKLTVHPAIDAASLDGDDTKKLAEHLWKIINSALETKSTR